MRNKIYPGLSAGSPEAVLGDPPRSSIAFHIPLGAACIRGFSVQALIASSRGSPQREREDF